MKKKNKIMILFLLIWSIFIMTDFLLSKSNKKPIFAIPIFKLKDGGTIEYYGFGYKVIKYNILDNYETGQLGRKDTVFGL